MNGIFMNERVSELEAERVKLMANEGRTMEWMQVLEKGFGISTNSKTLMLDLGPTAEG
jgi:hypothetical protein